MDVSSALDGAYPVTVVDNSSNPSTRACGDPLRWRGISTPGATSASPPRSTSGSSTLGLPDTDVLLLNPDATIEPDVRRASSTKPGRNPHGRRAWRPPSTGRARTTPPPRCAGPFPRRGGHGPRPSAWGGSNTAGSTSSRRSCWSGASALIDGRRSGRRVLPLRRGSRLGASGDEARGGRSRIATRRRPPTSAPPPNPTRAGARCVFTPGWNGTYASGTARWGWRSYQAATLLTALRRAAVSRNGPRRAALHLARLYASGPQRRALTTGAVPKRQHREPALGGAAGNAS